MLEAVKQEQSAYELANLYRAIGKIDEAIKHFTVAKQEFRAAKDYDQYLKCQNALLHIFAEGMEFDQINLIKEEVQDLVLKESIQLTAKTYCALGICAKYKDNDELSGEYFHKALDLAFEADSKEDMAYAMFGIAVSYFSLGEVDKAEQEISKLDVFFEIINEPSLKIATDIMKGVILIEKKQYTQALEKLWITYETLKKEYDINSFINVLYTLGKAYVRMGKQEEAKLYLGLAKKSTPQYFQRKLSNIDKLIAEIDDSDISDYDLVVDMNNHSILEKTRGEIDFKNQFILLDLMQLLAKEPGKIFSKEDLVKHIWNQDYNPSVHDNKVYVTIKRLRKLVEPDIEKPFYIYRSKNGYFLNQNLKVKIQRNV